MKSIVIFIVIFSLWIEATSIDSSNQKGSIVINLAGKQRMLTQKMSKEALLIAKGIEVEENQKMLRDTISLFDKTLKGLKSGDSSLSLPKTEDPKVIKRIDKVSKLWNEFKSFIEKVADGKVDKITLKAIEMGNIPLLKGMDSIVKMYEESYKSNLVPHMAKTINLAGRERMLIQKMTKELLCIANKLESNLYMKSLKSGGKLFNQTLSKLMNDENAMTDPKISKKVMEVKSLWSEYQNSISNAELSEEGVKKFSKKEVVFMKKMNKKLIEVASAIDKKSYLNELKKTANLFDTTLSALINGDSSLGIVKSSNSAIIKQLKEVEKLWKEYKKIIVNVDISESGLKKVMDINMPLLYSMDKAVKMYELENK